MEPDEINAQFRLELNHRQITLQDGRYLIFYTFDEHMKSDTGEPEEERPQDGAATKENVGA